MVGGITGITRLGDGARHVLRRRRRDRAGRHVGRRAARAPEGGQGLRARADRSAPRSNFFRKGNLIALREIALRRTADVVEDEVQGTAPTSRSSACGRRRRRCCAASARIPAPSTWCAAPRGSRRSSASSGPRSTSRRPRCSACRRASASASCETVKLAEELGATTAILTGSDDRGVDRRLRAHQNSRTVVVGRAAARRAAWRARVSDAHRGARAGHRRDRDRPRRRDAGADRAARGLPDEDARPRRRTSSACATCGRPSRARDHARGDGAAARTSTSPTS